MGQNKFHKAKRLFMNYMMVMQFIVTAVGLSLIGYVIGKRVDSEGNLYLILTGVGLGLGVFVGFVTLIQMIRSEERHERSLRH